MATGGKTFSENILRVVALLGLLAVLILGAWGIIQVAFFISSLFSNSGSSSEAPAAVHETTTLSLPSSVLSGQEVSVRWGHQGGSGAYSYALSYSCAPGLSFKAPVPTGALQSVPCNTPFNFTNATSSLVIVPSTSAQATTSITVYATQLSSGKVTSSATSGLTVTTASGSTATPKPATPKPAASTYVSSGHRSNLYGYADLAVNILSAVSYQGNTTVQFVVTNIGTNASPSSWSFNALLPISGSYTYPSGPQQALYPGDKIVYTLVYEDPYNVGYPYGGCAGYTGSCIGSPSYNPYDPNYYTYGYGGASGLQKSVSIIVDPYNQIPDPYRANNIATASYSPR
jgi:hypothetical protein